MRMAWRRMIGAAAGSLLLPGVVAAQDATTSLGEILQSRGLRPGDGIYVIDTRGHRLKGNLSDLSTDALEITHRGRKRTLTGAEVFRIDRQDSWANGIGYGVLLGAASFFGWCHAVGGRECGLYTIHPRFGGIFMLAGGVAGAVVDANMHKTVFLTSRSARASVKPFVTKGAFGAQVSFGW